LRRQKGDRSTPPEEPAILSSKNTKETPAFRQFAQALRQNLNVPDAVAQALLVHRDGSVGVSDARSVYAIAIVSAVDPLARRSAPWVN
jgi:hypothetical protein